MHQILVVFYIIIWLPNDKYTCTCIQVFVVLCIQPVSQYHKLLSNAANIIDCYTLVIYALVFVLNIPLYVHE